MTSITEFSKIENTLKQAVSTNLTAIAEASSNISSAYLYSKILNDTLSRFNEELYELMEKEDKTNYNAIFSIISNRTVFDFSKLIELIQSKAKK